MYKAVGHRGWCEAPGRHTCQTRSLQHTSICHAAGLAEILIKPNLNAAEVQAGVQGLPCAKGRVCASPPADSAFRCVSVQANASALVGNRLTLLLDDDLDEVEAAAAKLRVLLPNLLVDKFIEYYPQVLDIDDFELALQVGEGPRARCHLTPTCLDLGVCVCVCHGTSTCPADWGSTRGARQTYATQQLRQGYTVFCCPWLLSCLAGCQEADAPDGHCTDAAHQP